ncbi:hypothetical protein D6D28_10354 [Aureobasidium pullulans]|uniref:Uncharacterized protein n=1 Tax=Aureobasidium pullulans TaxID=5580 RepID=A0A4S8RZP7_AURPU|nr:hypothetical protein D6D28_10354 [Aureobasidium pullulans]
MSKSSITAQTAAMISSKQPAALYMSTTISKILRSRASLPPIRAPATAATSTEVSNPSTVQPVLLIKMELDLSKLTTTLAIYLPTHDIKAIMASALDFLDINYSTSKVYGDKGEQKEEA